MKNYFISILVSLVVLAFLLPFTSLAQEEFVFGYHEMEDEILPVQLNWIGVLQGTWHEMGVQYGQRCGKDIASIFDKGWEGDVLGSAKGSQLWQQGRNNEERAEYCAKYMERTHEELGYLSPELSQFFEGIAEGAADDLDKCKYADALPHVLKLTLLNYRGLNFHPNWDFENNRPLAMLTDQTYANVDVEFDHGCNGLWVSGNATKTGDTYAARASQGTIFPSGSLRQVMYVAIPKDPNVGVFWGAGRAGNIGGGPGGGILNEYGVYVATSGAQYKEAWELADITTAPGMKDHTLAAYGAIFSKTAREAAERITVGTERYREITGRKTVLRARGACIMFGDAEEAILVEQNARRYAIREPGYCGEKGGDYIVHPNHFKYADGSFDENNVFHSDDPMDKYCPEKEGDSSYYRFWGEMWELNNNYGKIDEEMIMRKLVTLHVGYDEAGNRYDPDPVTGAPTVGTFCSHTRPSAEFPLGVGGDQETTVFNLSTLEVWMVPAWPCHYAQWNINWSYVDLKPYVEYRKLLWGY